MASSDVLVQDFPTPARVLRECHSSGTQHFVPLTSPQMGVYAALGISQAVTGFFMFSTLAMLTFFVSKRLHKV
jgi:hypothetical protein